MARPLPAPDGRERSRTFTRKVDAERWLNGIEVSKAKGDWIDPVLGWITAADWSERWWATTVNLKPKTRAGYRSLLDRHVIPAFGAWSLAGIQPLDVREWVADLSGRMSASRVRQAYRVLAAVMDSAAGSGYIGRSPCHGVQLPRVPHSQMLFVDAGQVEGLVDEMDNRYRTSATATSPDDSGTLPSNGPPSPTGSGSTICATRPRACSSPAART